MSSSRVILTCTEPDFLVNLATPGTTPIEPVGAPNSVDMNDVDGKNSVTVFGSLQMFSTPINSTYYRRVSVTDLFHSGVSYTHLQLDMTHVKLTRDTY